MPKRKNFYKNGLSIGVISLALLVAGCGTADNVAEPATESEETELESTTASGGSDELEEEQQEQVEQQEPEETETETADADTAEEAESGDVPEDQQGIGTDFPIGTALSELVGHYGEPTYDEYFMGARLVAFEEEDGYFLDWEEVVTGFMIASPEINIFDVNVGMTFEELNATMPNSGEVFFDESETQDYGNIYFVEGYKLMFYAETEDGPTSYAFVVQDK